MGKFFALSIPVDLPAMAYSKSQHDKHFIANVADDAIVPNSIAPQTGTSAFQRFTEMPGVLASLDTVVEPVENAAPDLRIQFAELTCCRFGDLNGPGQALS